MKLLYIMVAMACLTGCMREYHVNIIQYAQGCEDKEKQSAQNVVILNVTAEVPKDIRTDAKGELSIPASIIP